MKAGGAVKKAAKGGFLKESPGKAYPGFPHSPTGKAKDAVSAHKKGGTVKLADGGEASSEEGPDKLQFGGAGGAGGMGGVQAGPGAGSPGGSGLLGLFPGRSQVPPQQGAPTISGRQAIPFQQANIVPMSRMGTSALTRPAPGTTTTYAKKGGAVFKKGGPVHSDEAQDKKLIAKMIAKEDKAEKRARGGTVRAGEDTTARGLAGHPYHQQGKGYAAGGSVSAAPSSGVGRLARSKAGIDRKGEL